MQCGTILCNLCNVHLPVLLMSSFPSTRWEPAVYLHNIMFSYVSRSYYCVDDNVFRKLSEVAGASVGRRRNYVVRYVMFRFTCTCLLHLQNNKHTVTCVYVLLRNSHSLLLCSSLQLLGGPVDCATARPPVLRTEAYQ